MTFEILIQKLYYWIHVKIYFVGIWIASLPSICTRILITHALNHIKVNHNRGYSFCGMPLLLLLLLSYNKVKQT